MPSKSQSKTEGIPQERITVYGRQDRYRLLKAKLAAKGIAVTEWFRQKMEEELSEPIVSKTSIYSQ